MNIKNPKLLAVLALLLFLTAIALVALLEESAAPPEPLPGDPYSRELVALAKQDLALRLGKDPSAIELVLFRETVWRDSSLGCPQPGGMYLQVLTPGYLIRLKVGASVYSYHGRNGNPPFLCEGR